MCLKLYRHEEIIAASQLNKPVSKKIGMRVAFQGPVPLRPMTGQRFPVVNDNETASEVAMLNWMITFFLLAIIAAMLGFGGLAGALAAIAKFIAVLFIALFSVMLVYGLVVNHNRHSSY